MKQQADKGHSERVFQEGDEVYLKLQPYIQWSVVNRASYKLSFKYFGPYQVMRKINDVAYELKLSEGSTIHPVFHVSQLKPPVRPTMQMKHTSRKNFHWRQLGDKLLKKGANVSNVEVGPRTASSNEEGGE
ncbi:hypothetical protein BS78_K102900 [Paspalum vaginatum]|uniref:Tf2-1-like SH3-like domain-containing protein n=1 Tax=Paspalum vaginatum TaxID=158149 RepID=A0A9W8CFA3_9POAL|nr:hypothetical protein BS78_K102900 [Paspalum vaginatum]